jgi:hypothetical protein
MTKRVRFRLHSWKKSPHLSELEKDSALPLLLRRRVTPIGQHALQAAWSLPEVAKARLVLSSRHGEFSRTLSLMQSLTKSGEISPADFSLSVHHALIGLLSIALGNRRGHTAVASGTESFCYGFMEALAALQENPDEPVILIHYDEPLPEPFSTFNNQSEQPIALALALNMAGEGEQFDFSWQPSLVGQICSQSHAIDFLHFIEGENQECISNGERHQWRWTRHALG